MVVSDNHCRPVWAEHIYIIGGNVTRDRKGKTNWVSIHIVYTSVVLYIKEGENMLTLT